MAKRLRVNFQGELGATRVEESGQPQACASGVGWVKSSHVADVGQEEDFAHRSVGTAARAATKEVDPRIPASLPRRHPSPDDPPLGAVRIEIPIEASFAPQPHEIAAHLVVEVVVEGALHAVTEQHPDQTGASFDSRGHLLDHGAYAPFLVEVVVDPVAKA